MFLRAHVNVIALQFAFGIGVFLLFWFALEDVQNAISQSIASGIVAIVNTHGTVTASDVLSGIESTRESEFIRLFLITIGTGIFFGFLIMRATLQPARDALAAQKRFISNIAHEIRTPLSIIKTNTEVLLLEHPKGGPLSETLRDTVAEVDRASGIINNLLSMNTYLDPERIQFEEIDLRGVVEHAVAALSQLADNKRVEVSVHARGDYYLVTGNATALEQIVINILRNAITHTPAQGHITIIVEPDYLGSIVLSVRDTGSGIAARDLAHIFEPYYRAESSRERAKGGSGLGLAIVSEIVKAHRGTVAVKSGLGEGTTVIVTLPCVPHLQEAEPHADSEIETVIQDFSRAQQMPPASR